MKEQDTSEDCADCSAKAGEGCRRDCPNLADDTMSDAEVVGLRVMLSAANAEIANLRDQVKRWEDKEASRGHQCWMMEKERDELREENERLKKQLTQPWSCPKCGQVETKAYATALDSERLEISSLRATVQRLEGELVRQTDRAFAAEATPQKMGEAIDKLIAERLKELWQRGACIDRDARCWEANHLRQLIRGAIFAGLEGT